MALDYRYELDEKKKDDKMRERSERIRQNRKENKHKKPYFQDLEDEDQLD